jgi:hypothetical protein
MGRHIGVILGLLLLLTSVGFTAQRVVVCDELYQET